MVRINIINPVSLTDQHLIAEYNEILMLIAYIRKYPKPNNIPQEYCLGKGHMLFFKNKLLYLKKRHELLKKEMKKRGFRASKTLNLRGFRKQLMHDWAPQAKDKDVIKKRLRQKLLLKPEFYRYHRKKEGIKKLLIILGKA